ncbi:uncharacterized protein LOC131317181 [Rhododendron vialii]|uniref:uncharacterized protein LOC131317181 n=1 Tax=Rhododendron vialii TaxID=182163 RepID=UPI00265FCC24|nr:uncharacterized protein LOC131317181 [Rhododendron vialii]
MRECKPVATPLIVNEKLSKEGSKKVDESLCRSLVGSLLYLTITRPDIMYATSMLSRFKHNASQTHFGVAKRVLRYLQASLATSQAIWLRRILEDVGEKQGEATPILCDNKFAIVMTKNPIYHSRTKHIAIKHHFIREAVEDEEIQLKYCATERPSGGYFHQSSFEGKVSIF